MKSLYYFFFILIIFLTLFLGYVLYEINFTKTNTRANSSLVSSENSYVFTNPVCGSSKTQNIRVTVFCIGNGRGISNLPVQFESHPKLTISIVQGVTDETGKATFDVLSTEPIQTRLNVFCNSINLKSKASICFE